MRKRLIFVLAVIVLFVIAGIANGSTRHWSSRPAPLAAQHTRVVELEVPLSAGDVYGVGRGWRLNVAADLPVSAIHVVGARASCRGVCTLPASDFPLAGSIPTGSAMPLAVTLLKAAPTTGMGRITVTPALEIPVPARHSAGGVDGTLRVALASGP